MNNNNYCIVCERKLLPQGQCGLTCLQKKLEVENLVKIWLELIRLYGTIKV